MTCRRRDAETSPNREESAALRVSHAHRRCLPGCKAQFRVSEKFAGKTGPCPKCKAKITIPAARPEVKVHAPEEAAIVGKDSKGRTISQPLPAVRREDEHADDGAHRRRHAGRDDPGLLPGPHHVDDHRPLLAAVGLAIISVPLVLAGYRIFREEEAEPHHGRPLYLRSAICAAIYALLWGVFAFVPNEWIIEYWSWFYITPPFLLAGAVTAFACLDLDLGNGFFHYCFYLAATTLFRYVIGMGSLWAATSQARRMQQREAMRNRVDRACGFAALRVVLTSPALGSIRTSPPRRNSSGALPGRSCVSLTSAMQCPSVSSCARPLSPARQPSIATRLAPVTAIPLRPLPRAVTACSVQSRASCALMPSNWKPCTTRSTTTACRT